MNEKIFNKRILGFAVCFFVMLIFSLLCLWLDETVLAIACIILSLLQIAFILITPVFYIFSEEKLTIKYFFGREENIFWKNIRAVVKNYESAFRYTLLDTYKIYYYSKEKTPFYMQGVVSKSKKNNSPFRKILLKKTTPLRQQFSCFLSGAFLSFASGFFNSFNKDFSFFCDCLVVACFCTACKRAACTYCTSTCLNPGTNVVNIYAA